MSHTLIFALRVLGVAACTVLIVLPAWEVWCEWTRPRDFSATLRGLIDTGALKRLK